MYPHNFCLSALQKAIKLLQEAYNTVSLKTNVKEPMEGTIKGGNLMVPSIIKDERICLSLVHKQFCKSY